MSDIPLRQRLRIGVMGPGTCDSETALLAREVGREVARAGAILICGGRGGVMEESARGAKSAGGVTVGILPGPDTNDANPWIDIPVATDLGNARNVVNVLSSDAIVAVRGGAGTLSEIALALKVGTPVVGLDTWEMVPPPGQSRPAVHSESTAAAAVKTALKLGAARRSRAGGAAAQSQTSGE